MRSTEVHAESSVCHRVCRSSVIRATQSLAARGTSRMSNFAAKAKQIPRIARLEEPGLILVVGHPISRAMCGAAHADPPTAAPPLIALGAGIGRDRGSKESGHAVGVRETELHPQSRALPASRPLVTVLNIVAAPSPACRPSPTLVFGIDSGSVRTINLPEDRRTRSRRWKYARRAAGSFEFGGTRSRDGCSEARSYRRYWPLRQPDRLAQNHRAGRRQVPTSSRNSK